MQRILVLGGYGFFGKRICAALAANPAIELLIAGRGGTAASAFAQSLGLTAGQGIALDATAADLSDRLRDLRVNLLIHAAGPFQDQDYAVPRAAIAARCHYIDLADGRQFVAGIGALDALARAQAVSIISGASSVPALSAAVVDRYLPQFRQLDALRIGIASGARVPGLAAVQGIFGYCGKPIRRLERGDWVDTHGWLDLQRHHFPAPVGSRWLGSCDVPDLALFPRRYPGVQTVTFHAGFASDPGHLLVWSLAGLVKAGLLRSALPFAAPLNRLSRWIEPWISDKGAMFVTLEGRGHDDVALRKTWYLLAACNDGPHIPCAAAIALANKFAAGDALPLGAQPCMGLLSVEDYLAPLHGLSIREVAA
jgi:saccharopine dehydrogenase-like NADP-dependent oxidoreductase